MAAEKENSEKSVNGIYSGGKTNQKDFMRRKKGTKFRVEDERCDCG